MIINESLRAFVIDPDATKTNYLLVKCQVGEFVIATSCSIE